MNHYCLGCYSCFEDKTNCPWWNDEKKIIDAMEEADIFIFTTSNYCLAPSGAMKSLLDFLFDMWMVHRPKEWMFKKKAIVLCASAGASCKKPSPVIKDSLFYWGVPYIKTYGLPVHAENWNNVPVKDKTKIDHKITTIAKKKILINDLRFI